MNSAQTAVSIASLTLLSSQLKRGIVHLDVGYKAGLVPIELHFEMKYYIEELIEKINEIILIQERLGDASERLQIVIDNIQKELK